ncbi:MAG: ABC transporter ATP-binding protein [Candidatus Lokiarchaeota archaeon]|nr:ABC transporter ATP-binding protein [Candidatus Lokiarchaeota archaeon]
MEVINSKDKIMIQTNLLTKYFGTVKAVDELNLNIPQGATYGLLGPNGSGKTTTVRMLNGIIKPTSGEAFIDGHDVKKNIDHIKLISGFLPESPGVYEKLSCVEFLEFIGELYSMPRHVLKTRIDELIELFELKGRENDLLEGYSRGMKQKVCLMSAIIHDPKVIFLDEPTSNLDPEASYMVRDLILQLARKADKTIFLCTHLLKHAQDMCDVIGIIKKGKLIIQGSPAEIISKMKAKDLEDAYLKIMGQVHEEDLLEWRK